MTAITMVVRSLPDCLMNYLHHRVQNISTTKSTNISTTKSNVALNLELSLSSAILDWLLIIKGFYGNLTTFGIQYCKTRPICDKAEHGRIDNIILHLL